MINKKNLKVVIDREDLTICYCDPISLETIEYIKFKTLEQLEEYINNQKNA